MKKLWQTEWDLDVNNKLHAVKPLIGEQPSASRSVRKEEVVMSRLRLGHPYLTHSYLLTCQCRLTVEHVLAECIEYDFFPPIYFGHNATLKDVFSNVSVDAIMCNAAIAHVTYVQGHITALHMSFIKRTRLFNKL